MKEYTFM